jgi:hypothetical protein
MKKNIFKSKKIKITLTVSMVIAVGVVISLFPLCTACENGKIKREKPDDLLEQKTFDSVLWDLYLIEGNARFHLRSEQFDSLRKNTTAEINAMYEKYNIDHERFMKSYAYYMKDPVLSEEIMKNIVNQLVELQAKEEVKEKGEAVKDK